MVYYTNAPPVICHHGIKGQRWGIRRFQNEDGSLTDKGKKRFAAVAKSSYEKKYSTKTATKMLRKSVKSTTKKINKLTNNGGDEKEIKALKSECSTANKRLSAISSGTAKAGRDFVVTYTKVNIPYAYVTTGPKIAFGKAKLNKILVYSEGGGSK